MNLQSLLTALDTKNKDFYENLSPDEKKEVSLWMMMRYMASSETYPDYFLCMVNEFVNVDFQALKNHPELQWKLLCLCGLGTKYKHTWIPPGKKKKKNKLEAAIAELKPELSHEEVKLFASIRTKEEIIGFFIERGFQQKDIDELVK